MKTNEQMRAVVRQLLDKTKARQADWRPGGDEEFTGCSLFLPQSSLHLTYVAPRAEADYIRIELVRNGSEDPPGSNPTFEAYVDSPDSKSQATDPQEAEDSKLLTELYREATNIAFRWDERFAVLDEALSRPGSVGLDRPPMYSSKEPDHAQRR